MSTDRELLELAAKAAGERGRVVQRHYRGALVDVFERVVGSFWMPHLDDGDALRLAVQLDISVRWHSVLNQAIARSPSLSEFVENGEDHSADRCAATRRAIVRAAAEIGRSMP
jgi:hypothetical protein